MIDIRKCILTNNDCFKANRYITPKGIMVHSTGADNPRLKRYLYPDDGFIGVNDYGNHWNRSGVGACVHGFIGKDINGKVRVYQTLPWNMRGWHCGASGNDSHISFEICEDSLSSRSYFEETRDAAIELCAYLCIEYGFDPLKDGVIIDHREGGKRGIASGHTDVYHWWSKFGYTMDNFRRDVSAKIVEEKELEKKEIQSMIDISVQKTAQSINTEIAEIKRAVELLSCNLSVMDKNMATIRQNIDERIDVVADAISEVGTVLAKRMDDFEKARPAPVIYKTIEDMPRCYRESIQRLIDSGSLKGRSSKNLDLTEEQVRLLVIEDREHNK